MKTIMSLLAVYFFLLNSSFAANPGNSDVIGVLKISNPPDIDGKLNETAWSEATTISDFIQRFPKDGKRATEKTEVYFMYTITDLYVGVRCFDTQPEKIVATVMQRDNFDLLQNEQFVIAIDSYNSGSNGYWFSTNPLGMRADCEFINEGETWICEWDGIWECKSRIDSLGWTAELKIPFSTMRFENKTENIMGINLFRRVIRTNEEVFSPHIPLQYPHGTADVSIAKKFLFNGISGGKSVYVQPYVLGGRQTNNTPSNSTVDTKREIGGEIRYNVTDNLTTNLSYNTDFAQVELDDRQINLTRFNLFFPEKRDFFLENAGLFAFGLPGEVEVFFSRTIGLAQNAVGRTTEVPILFGAKATGKAGKLEYGLMDVQTRTKDAIPRENSSVARVKYQVLPRSYFGLITTNKYSRGNFDNGTIGLDANILLSQDIGISGFAATAFSSRQSFAKPNSSAFNLTFFKRGERTSFNMALTDVDNKFDPGMGFLMRSDIRKWSGNLKKPLYVESKIIRRLAPEYTFEYFVNHDKKIENSWHRINLSTEFQSNDLLSFFYERVFEFVPYEFAAFKSIAVPTGNYTTYRGGGSLQSKQGRRFSTAFNFETGGFYDGTGTTWSTSLQWKANRHLTLFQDYETAWISFSGGSFRTHVVQARINYALNTNFFTNSLIQYDNESEELGINLRMNYQFREGRELFLVYNEILDEAENRLSRVLDQSKSRSIILKFNYLFNL